MTDKCSFQGEEEYTYEIEFVKKEYQTIQVKAFTEDQAVEKAKKLVKEDDWNDYGCDIESCKGHNI